MRRDYDYEFKLCLLGESQVGKTSILERYVESRFGDSSLATIGVDFKFKSFNHRGHFVKLQLWDTAGQEKFRSVIDKYYRDADAIIVVYDSQQLQTFLALDAFWLHEISKRASPHSQLYLFANKCEGTRGMGADERQWCKRQALMGFEVSAKTGEGIHEAIEHIVDKLIATRPKLQKEKMVMTLNETSSERPKKNCCK